MTNQRIDGINRGCNGYINMWFKALAFFPHPILGPDLDFQGVEFDRGGDAIVFY